MVQGKIFQVSVCGDPRCRNIHLGMLGDYSRPYIGNNVRTAEVAFPVENLASLLEDLKTAASEVTAKG